MSFCSINIFLYFLFDKQNVNKSSIHWISSQEDTNRIQIYIYIYIYIERVLKKTTKYKQTKTLKGCKTFNKKTILN
jgi:hypothetical protein